MTGRISSISEVLGRHTVALDDPNALFSIETVNCVVDQANVNQILPLSVGELVTVRRVR